MENIFSLKQSLLESSGSLEDKLNLALKLGCQVTETDVGIISNIKGETYTVKSVHPIDIGLETETVFELGNTYCDLTYKKGELVAIDHMSRSEHKLHPCYKSFKIESYIGDVYRIENDIKGTINFSSVPPREQVFSDKQKDFVRFLAEWLGQTLESRGQEYN